MNISEIHAAQDAYFRTGATRDYAFRMHALEQLLWALRRWEEKLAEAVYEDLHKAPSETYLCETGIVLDEIGYHMKHLHRWMRPRHVRTPLSQFAACSRILPEPQGTVLIMAPWNYPVQLCLEPLVGAISAGCCAIIKPSAYAPASSRTVARMLGEIFPPEYVAVVEGGRDENRALLEEHFDYIFFTGSPAVGHTVMAAAARTLTPVTLELGGKSPVIVDETADIAMAARRVAFGKVLNAGQTCVAPDYLLIQRSVSDEFARAYRAALEDFFPDGDMSGMTRIISDKHFSRASRLMECGTVVLGGGSDAQTRFIEPTLLTDVSPEDPIMQEEIFAPILPVLTWETPQEAIDLIRSRPRPLALYLFTQRQAMQELVFGSCSFGGACVNDVIVHLATPYMPFGGVGDSGMGAYHGKASFDTFTHYRSVMERSPRIDLPIRYHPYTEAKDRLVHRFLK